MPKEDEKAAELREAEEVFDFVLPSCDKPAEVVHPGEEPFHFPTSSVASQLPSILGPLYAIPAVGRDHCYAVFLGHGLVECIRVIRFVADQTLG
jgi:hypothetical protein